MLVLEYCALRPKSNTGTRHGRLPQSAFAMVLFAQGRRIHRMSVDLVQPISFTEGQERFKPSVFELNPSRD